MFDEAEPGKPKNWGWTIGIIITICLINLCIFIVLRLFLDAVDEYGEPLLQGDTRRDLEAFLGVFALSFCFGCWCCFCCAGNCLECIIFCFKSENRPTMTQWWSRMIRHKTDIMEKTKRRKDTVTSDIRKMSRRLKTAYTNENFCESDAEAQVQQTAAVGAKRSIPPTRPKVIFNVGPTESRPEMRAIESGRRSSQWMEMKRPSLIPGQSPHTSVGVKNVDYYEIPVSLVTPEPIAIIDPKFVDRQTQLDPPAKEKSPQKMVVFTDQDYYADAPSTSTDSAQKQGGTSSTSV